MLFRGGGNDRGLGDIGELNAEGQDAHAAPHPPPPAPPPPTQQRASMKARGTISSNQLVAQGVDVLPRVRAALLRGEELAVEIAAAEVVEAALLQVLVCPHRIQIPCLIRCCALCRTCNHHLLLVTRQVALQ